jgi:hypothetical protein
MSLTLTQRDQEMLDGAHGPAVQMAMSILAKMAVVFNAEKLLDISAAHIDSTIYIGESGMEYAERLADLGAQVAVPTTLNVSGLDEHHWQEWSVPDEWASNAHRQMLAYQSMGAVPTWTCTPYQTAYRPKFGQQIAWGESNAIVFANSVIGARTERYPDLLDICCAITGRAPAAGLHLKENRAGEVQLNMVDIPSELQAADEFYPVFGHLAGKLAGDRIPVITGMGTIPTDDQHKAFGAAAATSGQVALYHIVGVTPEAPNLEAATHGKPVQEFVDISMRDLLSAKRELSTTSGRKLDMVALGCPHFSLDEFGILARLIDGKGKSPDVQMHITSNRDTIKQAKYQGYIDKLAAFGAKFTVDTCILATPMLGAEIRTLMTNSGKYAYYTPGLLGKNIVFGSLEDCAASAIAGRIVRDESIWGI